MTVVTVTIVDYGAGNLRSVAKAIERLGHRAQVTGDPDALAGAQAVILPGVGASDSAMRALHERGLVEPVLGAISSGVPFFGVCLGMQLLMDSSDEGTMPCLGAVAGGVQRFPVGEKVPHMGWNQVSLRGEHPVFRGVENNSFFYFVHSFYAVPTDPEHVLGTTEYGVEFCSVIARGNLVATQFHPEKSGLAGLRLYENFLGLVAGG